MKPLLSSIALLILLGFYPQNAFAEGFTGEQFLTWPRESQDSLIQVSITMTGIVATQGRKDISRCIDDWYTADDAIQNQRHGYILDIIRENSSYHPQAVILSILQKKCGSFKVKSD